MMTNSLQLRELPSMAMPQRAPIRSRFLAGFECSTHRRIDGVRLDLVHSTGHEQFVKDDYKHVAAHGILGARDGLRWYLIEQEKQRYQWDSWLAPLRAARAANVDVIWDLCHYGWPDDLDVWSADFVDRFARFAAAAARVLRNETGQVPMFCPINEISYLSWAGAEVGHMNPGGQGRGRELKRQLIRAYIAAVHAIRDVEPRARFLVSEPLIHVASGAGSHLDHQAAEDYRLSQFEMHDMLTGRAFPDLGGDVSCLDIVGVNFYPDNQWYLGGSTIPLGHHAYRPLREMLCEISHRYHRPVLISETGAEGASRPYWLHYVCTEARQAAALGCPVEGICLYPILDYHGWDNDRHCRAGLLSMPGLNGRRSADAELLHELRLQISLSEAGSLVSS